MARLIPKGKHRAQPKNRTFKQDDDGRDFVLIFFTILTGIAKGEEVGRRFYMHTEGSAKFTIDVLRTCGCTFPGNDILSAEGFGAEVDLVVEHEQGRNGQTYSEIKWVNQPGGGDGFKGSEDSKSAFRSRFAHLLGGGGGAGAEAGSAGPRSYNPDDVPF